ncbi:MAG: hypothetical protein HPY59_02945 [Anaerolineae bacterium]|nr:hypothetical protein [Anaerolineae bacterium]
MTKSQKRVLLLLIFFGSLYFILFIPPNLTGAKDANMLALFEVDEYAQYPHALGMLTLGETAYQTLRNFLIYLHYFYGYPFYFFSALALFPLKLIFGAGWQVMTPVILLVLRQVINVLPMLVSLLLWVWMQTRFRSWWRALGLFALLLSVPVVVLNNLWWHPDSLVFLFVTLTIFFLNRDALHFGRNFFLAAISCGLATGTKHLGLFFVLAVPVYILWGVFSKRLRWGKAVGLGALFVLLMTLAVVVSNPLLLLPMERAEIIAVQKLQFQQTSVGILTANQQTFFADGYPEDIRIHYGEALFILLAFSSLVAGILKPERRLLNVLILTWMIPLTFVILNFGTRRTHYFLPVMIPLFSTFANVFLPFSPSTQTAVDRFERWYSRVLGGLYALLILGQMFLFVRTDVEIYLRTLFREATSASIKFYEQVEENVMSKMPEEKITAYRDWHIYFPDTPSRQVEMNWNLATYDYIRELKPDLILLERENLSMFARPEVVGEAVDPDRMEMVHEFYAAAAKGRLQGYRQVYQSDFGLVFVDEALFNTFFASK